MAEDSKFALGGMVDPKMFVSERDSPEVFVSTTTARVCPSIEGLDRASRAAQAATQKALLAYLSGELTEAVLETTVRAEADARFRYQSAKARAEMDAIIPQMMEMARQKYQETAALRDPRPYARGRG